MEIKTAKKETKPNLNYMRDKDREKVTGIFRYHELSGGTMAFSIRLYKNDPVETYTMKDGEVVTIPLGVAKHINKNMWYPEYGYVRSDSEEKNAVKVVKKVRRCSFSSLEFSDIEDLESRDSLPVVNAGV
jgi:hypothetical protein